MGCVREAVLEFDEEVRAPWRPRLVPDFVTDAPSVSAAPRLPSRRSPSRVGVCRPPVRALPADGGRAVPVGREDVRRLHGHRPAPRGAAAAPVGTGRRAAVRSSSTGLRLTRRARRLAVGIALCGGIVLGSWVAPLLSGGADDGLHLAGVSSVVVEQGDTLWSIAESVADGEDVRLVVDRIQELNGLEGAGLVPGQVLRLP